MPRVHGHWYGQSLIKCEASLCLKAILSQFDTACCSKGWNYFDRLWPLWEWAVSRCEGLCDSEGSMLWKTGRPSSIDQSPICIVLCFHDEMPPVYGGIYHKYPCMGYMTCSVNLVNIPSDTTRAPSRQPPPINPTLRAREICNTGCDLFCLGKIDMAGDSVIFSHLHLDWLLVF